MSSLENYPKQKKELREDSNNLNPCLVGCSTSVSTVLPLLLVTSLWVAPYFDVTSYYKVAGSSTLPNLSEYWLRWSSDGDSSSIRRRSRSMLPSSQALMASILLSLYCSFSIKVLISWKVSAPVFTSSLKEWHLGTGVNIITTKQHSEWFFSKMMLYMKDWY